MNRRLIELAARKERLVMRSELLRGQLAAHARQWAPLFDGIDTVRDIGRWLRRHPEIVSAAVAFLLIKRPRALVRWARRAWVGWKLWSGLRGRATQLATRR